jgi:hypothetical protein
MIARINGRGVRERSAMHPEPLPRIAEAGAAGEAYHSCDAEEVPSSDSPLETAVGWWVGRWNDESETRSTEVLGRHVRSLVEPRAALAWASVRECP